jgi:hypothetical protein
MDMSVVLRQQRIYNQPNFTTFLRFLQSANLEKMKVMIAFDPNILGAEQDKGGNWLFTLLDGDFFTPEHVPVFKFLHGEMKQSLAVYGEYDQGLVAGNILHKFFLFVQDRDSYEKHVESKKEILRYILENLKKEESATNLNYAEHNQHISVISSLWCSQTSVVQYCLPIIREYLGEEYIQSIKAQSFDYLALGQYAPLSFRILNAYHGMGNFELFEQLHPDCIDWKARNRNGDNIAFQAVNAHHIYYTIPLIFDRLKKEKLDYLLQEISHDGYNILFYMMIHLNMTPQRYIPDLLSFIAKSLPNMTELLEYRNAKGFALSEHLWGRGRKNIEVQRFFQSFLDNQAVPKINLDNLES